MGGNEDATRPAGDAASPQGKPPGGPAPDPNAPTAPMAPPPMLGAWIGSYRLMERLDKSRSGFGQVFLARRNDAIQMSVAIKVIRPGADTREVLARFEQERRLLAVLDHPNIAKILDAGETADGRPYFVMELIRGDIITAFADQHALTTDQRVALMLPVCDAVHYAHLKGIIHRDLKPGNIMVSEGAEARPMVIDFGIAKVLSGPLSDATLTTRGPIGTPDYVSPEQARGEPVDAATDVYGLCAVLYHLVTGQAPLEHLNLREVPTELVFPAIGAASPRRPRAVNHDLPRDLETILLCGLHPDRKRRYQNAGELGDDLRRYLAGEPVHAKADSPLYTLRTRTSSLVAHNVGAAVVIAWLVISLAAYFGLSPLVFASPGIARSMQGALQFVAPAGGPLDKPLRDVRVVEFRDDAPPIKTAQAGHVEGVDESAPRSERRAYALLMKHAAAAGAGVVLLDATFLGDSPEDDLHLAGAIDQCRKAGTRVIFVCRLWPGLDIQPPPLSAALLDSITGEPDSPAIGGNHAFGLETPQPYLTIFTRRQDGEPAPSAALLAAAAVRHLGSGTSFHVEDTTCPTLVVGYWTLGANQARTPGPERDRIRLQEIQDVVEPNDYLGQAAGDKIGILPLAVRIDPVLDEVSISALQFMSMNQPALRQFAGGRVVIIGDARTVRPGSRGASSQNDLQQVGGNRVVSGARVLACGTQRLIDLMSGAHGVACTLSPVAAFLETSVVALGGVLLGFRRKNRLVFVLVCVLMLGVAILVGSACVYLWWGFFANPAVPILTLAVSGALGYLISDLRAHVPELGDFTRFRNPSSSGGAP